MRSALLDGPAFQKDPLAFLRSRGPLNDVARFKAGFSRFTLLLHPDLIERVLVTENDCFGEGKWTLRGNYVMGDCLITQEGAVHRERRALIQPLFGARKIADTLPAMVGHIDRISDRWKDGDEIDAFREMGNLALEIAGEALFRKNLEEDAEAITDSLRTMIHAIPRLPIPRPKLLKAKRRLRRTVAELNGSDYHARLAAAGLNDVEIRDELVSMLIAGVDTTPGALAWIWFLLGRNETVEIRVHRELDDLLGGRTPGPADLGTLPYLERVINETLRLFPSVHFIDRRPLNDIRMDGEILRKDDYILLSPLLTHRDSRFFDAPEAFEPDRWLPENVASRPKFSFFPFGAGPHSCIGEGLARLELKLVIATLAQRWRLVPDASMPDAPSPQTRSFPMRIERRR